MSLIVQDYLNELNIKTIVENKSISGILKENNWAYKKSYQASRIAISETIINNPSLKMIIDLHRDSSSLEKTLLEYNNKKYARILFVVGEDHSNYQENLALSENLKNILEEKIPNITRGITIKGGDGVNGIYNQDLSNKSILIELGGQYNEIEELNNTLEILSKSIQTYIEGENEKLN
jgi:stage II sporulation protein P